MKPADFSKEIFEKYFGFDSRVVIITLQDNTELAGKLVGFFHGDEDEQESFITSWRFVSEKQLHEINILPYPEDQVGSILQQKDIKAIRYK